MKERKHAIDSPAVTVEDLLCEQNILKALSGIKPSRSRKDRAAAKRAIYALRSAWTKQEAKIIASIRNGSYEPGKLRATWLAKPKGGFRKIEAPAPLDRVVLAALNQVLVPILDPSFSEFSFGFRPKRNVHLAVRTMIRFVESGFPIVLKLDIENCYESLFQEHIINRLSGLLDWQTMEVLISSIQNSADTQPRERGVPQGPAISPLMANLALHRLDQFLEEKSIAFVRYGDDCALFFRSLEDAQAQKDEVKPFLEENLGLKTSKKKSGIFHYTNVEFLGFEFDVDLNLRIPKDRIHRLEQNLKEIAREAKCPKSLIKKANQAVRGWLEYYKVVELSHALKMELNHQLLEVIRGKHPRYTSRKTGLSSKHPIHVDHVFDRHGRLITRDITVEALTQLGLMNFSHPLRSS